MTVVSDAGVAASARRRLVAALATVFVVDALTSLVILAYGNAYLLEQLHAKASAPALALTVYGVVKLLAAPFAGHLVDRARTAPVVVAAGTFEVVALAVIVVTHSAAGYFVGVGALALAIAVTWILAFDAMGAASHVSKRGTTAAVMSMISATATGGGFGAAVVIAQTGPWWAPFAIGVVLASASVALLLVAAPDGVETDEVDDEVDAPATSGEVDTPYLTNAPLPARLAAAAVVFGHFAVITGLLVVFWPFTLDQLALSPVRAALALVPAGCTALVVLVAAGRRSRHGHRLRQAAALYVLGTAGMAITASATNAVWFALGTALLAPALGGAQPVLIASMIDVSRMADRSGAALGWLFSAEGLGGIAGPGVVGIVIELAGVRAGAYAIVAATGLLALLAASTARTARL